MKRLLLITLLDYRGRSNNRIHQTVNALRGEFDEIWLLCRVRSSTDGSWRRLRNILPFPTRVFRDGSVRIVEYDPPLNYVEGYSGDESVADGASLLKSIVNFLGLIREFLFILTIGYASLRHLRGRFHICVVETFWEGVVALFLRSIGKVKYCVFDDNDFNPGNMRNSLRRRWETMMDGWCVRSADLSIAAGHLLADFWREKTGSDVLVIPNGVDLSSFRPGGRERKEVCRLVYTGTLTVRWVDFDLILQSMSRLRERGIDLSLSVVGHGRSDYIEGIEEQIRACHLTDRVELIGEVDHKDLPAILDRCDIGLAISPENLLRRYAFPLKVLEYMAMGLPVVANKGTETEWIIENYGVGTAVDPKVDELCGALTRLVEDTDYYEECRSRAISGAREFDIRELAEKRRETLRSRFFRESAE